MASKYEQLVKALRECASYDPDCIYNCPYYNHDVCADDLKSDAAAAIEALQAELDKYHELCDVDEIQEVLEILMAV